jgi:hypothetical protein
VPRAQPTEGIGRRHRSSLDDEESRGPIELSEFERYEIEPVPFTTRLPAELVVQLKIRAIRSTIQVLAEHAFTLYLGSRLPPSLLAGREWPEEYPPEPKPDYLDSKLRSFTVRLPRHLLRSSRVHAAEAEVTEQELAVRVFDWYLRMDRIPPKREDVKRSWWGGMVTPGLLIGERFSPHSPETVMKALEILVDRQTMYRENLTRPEGDLGYVGHRDSAQDGSNLTRGHAAPKKRKSRRRTVAGRLATRPTRRSRR